MAYRGTPRIILPKRVTPQHLFYGPFSMLTCTLTSLITWKMQEEFCCLEDCHLIKAFGPWTSVHNVKTNTNDLISKDVFHGQKYDGCARQLDGRDIACDRRPRSPACFLHTEHTSRPPLPYRRCVAKLQVRRSTVRLPGPDLRDEDRHCLQAPERFTMLDTYFMLITSIVGALLGTIVLFPQLQTARCKSVDVTHREEGMYIDLTRPRAIMSLPFAHRFAKSSLARCPPSSPLTPRSSCSLQQALVLHGASMRIPG